MFKISDTIFEQVPEIQEKLGSIDSAIDCNYPHIAEKLLMLWGSTECLSEIEWCLGYIHTAERPMRQGFDLTALRELQIILESHMNQYPFINTDYTMSIREGKMFW